MLQARQSFYNYTKTQRDKWLLKETQSAIDDVGSYTSGVIVPGYSSDQEAGWGRDTDVFYTSSILAQRVNAGDDYPIANIHQDSYKEIANNYGLRVDESDIVNGKNIMSKAQIRSTNMRALDDAYKMLPLIRLFECVNECIASAPSSNIGTPITNFTPSTLGASALEASRKLGFGGNSMGAGRGSLVVFMNQSAFQKLTEAPLTSIGFTNAQYRYEMPVYDRNTGKKVITDKYMTNKLQEMQVASGVSDVSKIIVLGEPSIKAYVKTGTTESIEPQIIAQMAQKGGKPVVLFMYEMGDRNISVPAITMKLGANRYRIDNGRGEMDTSEILSKTHIKTSVNPKSTVVTEITLS